MTTLLIDGDWICFSLACAFTKENPFVEGEVTFDGTLAKSVLDKKVRRAVEKVSADKVVFYFSCNRKDNWRRTVVESYKMNRKGKLSPIGLMPLKLYCMDSYNCVEEPTLEADDLIGMDATGKYKKGGNVIYSVDKDFLTIPTTIFNPQKNTIVKQSRVAAFKFFIYQVIIGDTSDGYKGIPGIGKVGATKFLTKHSKNLANIWEPLVELGATKKCTEEYMLQQARMAHILQEGDYDYATNEVNLWKPEDIAEMI